TQGFPSPPARSSDLKYIVPPTIRASIVEPDRTPPRFMVNLPRLLAIEKIPEPVIVVVCPGALICIVIEMRALFLAAVFTVASLITAAGATVGPLGLPVPEEQAARKARTVAAKRRFMFIGVPREVTDADGTRRPRYAP